MIGWSAILVGISRRNASGSRSPTACDERVPSNRQAECARRACPGDQPVVAGHSRRSAGCRRIPSISFCMPAAATGSIGEGDARWRTAILRTIIPCQRPEVSGLGFARAGTKHRSRVSPMKSLDERFRSVINASKTGAIRTLGLLVRFRPRQTYTRWSIPTLLRRSYACAASSLTSGFSSTARPYQYFAAWRSPNCS